MLHSWMKELTFCRSPVNGVGLLIPISLGVPWFAMLRGVWKERVGVIGKEGSRGFRESNKNEAASSGSESDIDSMLTSSLSTCHSSSDEFVSCGPSSVSV